jgi:Sulfotransferase family
MKAGTTTLFDHLAGHPAVAASSDKEPKYFARDSVYERGPDWYASLWDWDPATHSIAMEASTHYSFRHEHPETAARMAAHPGEFRLVYLVREPVARVESHYHHALAAGWRVADRPLGVPIHPDLVDPCRYAWQLDAYTEQFPRESILVLSFEELVADTEGTVERVLEHWGLPTEGFSIDTGLVRNSSSGKVVSTRVHSARKVPGSAWLAERLSPTSRRKIKALIGSGTKAPHLDEAGRDALRDELAEDHRRLAAEWGVDVGVWQAAD